MRRTWNDLVDRVERRIPTPLLLVIVATGALVLRILSFAHFGMRRGGDTENYQLMAGEFISGIFKIVYRYPAHSLYPLLLSLPMRLGLQFESAVIVVNCVLSVASALLVFGIVYRSSRSKFSGAAGAFIFSAYPAVLFWVVYALSETIFFFLLLAYALACVIYLSGQSKRALFATALLGLAMVVCRPTALVVLLVTVPVLIGVSFRAAGVSFRGAWAIGVGSLVIGGLAVPVALTASPEFRNRVLSSPYVATILNLSIGDTSSDIYEYANRPYYPVSEVTEVQRGIIAIQGLPPPDERSISLIISSSVIEWIAGHPSRFGWFCIRRYVSFWFPGLFQSGWTRMHRIADTIIILSLLSGAVAGLALGARESRAPGLLLLGTAQGLALLSALTHVDTDARYRVAAEVLLIPLFGMVFRKFRNIRPTETQA